MQNSDFTAFIDKKSFQNSLYAWYAANARSLPWRDTTDAYIIWLSEIILQQTRVEQGLPYFERFVSKYPTVRSFAAANEDELLKLWQGLGYYSRVRNMHQAAKAVVEKHGGEFPKQYDDIIALKGVGEYTAAAIASFAYKLPYVVVDGNVNRFLARLFAVQEPLDTAAGKKLIKACADALFDHEHADVFNQAIMEYGALQCKPKQVNCGVCIFASYCEALALDLVYALPQKRSKVKVRNRYFTYYVIEHNAHIYLVKRVESDIWKNLYEFPSFEDKHKSTEPEALSKLNDMLPDVDYTIQHFTPWKYQVLSHQKIHYRFLYLQICASNELCKQWVAASYQDIINFAVPKPIEYELRKILEK